MQYQLQMLIGALVLILSTGDTPHGLGCQEGACG